MKMNKKLVSLILALMLICMGALGLAEVKITYMASAAENAAKYDVPDAVSGMYTVLKPDACGFNKPDGKVFDTWLFYMYDAEESAWMLQDVLSFWNPYEDPKVFIGSGSNNRFVANWADEGESAECTLTYDLAGGSVIMYETENNNKPYLSQSWSYTEQRNAYHQLPPAADVVGPDNRELDYWMIGTTQYDPHTWHQVTGDLTIKAVWKEAPAMPCTVSFDLGSGGEGSMPSKTVNAGESIKLENPNRFAKEEYTFLHWTLDGQEYDAGMKYTVTGDVTFTAEWDLRPVQLIYADSDGTEKFTVNAKYGDKHKVLPPDHPNVALTAPNGYEFGGWTVYNTEGTPAPGVTAVVGQEMELHSSKWYIKPNWVPMTGVTKYTVTYKPGEGTGDDGTEEVEAGTTLQVPGVDVFGFKKEHHELLYWRDENGKVYYAGDPITVNGNMILTAIWQVTYYKVVYDANGGTGTIDAPFAPAGEYYLDHCFYKAPAGKQFKCWSVDGVEYDEGDTITLIGNVTVKAIWEDIPEVYYTITFESGETVEGTMAPVSVKAGSKYTLPACTFTAPEGDVFWKWNVFGGGNYDTGDEIVVNQDTRLIARWTVRLVSLTYQDADGNNTGHGQKNVQWGQTFQVYTPEDVGLKTPEGKSFGGWKVYNTDGTAANVTAVAGEEILLTDDWLIRPVWVDALKYYTVSYLPGDKATGEAQTMQVASGTEIQMLDPDNTPWTWDKSQHFDYWKLSAGEGKYRPSQPYTVTGNVTFIAQWKTRTVSLTYQTAEGAEVKKVQGDYGMEHIVLTPEAAGLTVPTNQKFAGWKVYNSRGGELDDVTAVTGQPITLYSEWLIRPVWVDLDKMAVSFATGEGGGKQDTAYVYEGHEYVLPGCTFTAPLGKAFDAWGIGDKSYQPGETIKVNAATTVVALWKPATVTLTFKANNSSQAEEKVSMLYGTVYTLPECMFTADGNQVFDRWRINGAGFDAGSTYTVTGDFDVLADWANPEYTMTLYANNGTDDKVTEVVKFRDTFILPANSFEAPYGKQFSHWLLETPAGNEPCDVGAEFSKVKANLTFKAIWVERDKLTVRFAAGEGSGKQNEASVYVGYEYKLPVCTFTAPVGKTFEAWSVGGAVYQPGETIKVNEPTTVLALWKTATVKLTFKANNSSRGELEHEVLYGTQYPMPECTFVPDKDKVFENWRIGSEYYDEGATYTVYGDTTITAMWVDEWYTFSYVDSYDNTKKGEETIKYKTSLTLGSPDDFGMKPREYHKFAHWEVDGVAYAPGKEIPYDSLDKEITAMWEFDQSRVDTKVEETPVEISSEMTQEEVSQAIVEAFGEEEVEKLLDALPPEITKPAQIVDVIEDAIPPEYETETMTLQNVELMFKPEGSDEWVKATAENFPTTGIAHTLDLNDGTSPDTHDYAIAHMIVDGEEKGEVEMIDIENVDENGVTGRFYSLSPVSVVAKPKQMEGTVVGDAVENLPKTGDASCLMGWITLLGASGLGLKAIKRRKK